MTKNLINGSCLARSLETQALEGTGFRTSLRQFISHLDESQKAYDMIAVDDPATKCLFVASMVKWAHLANFRLLDYLEKINKGDCDEVLALDYAKLCNKNYWLRGKKKSDMMAYSDKPLKYYLEIWNSDETSWDLYQLYESNVCELADNLKKVKSTFDKPELYEKLMQQMKEQYADPDIEYEYEQIKEAYVEPSMNDFLKMQVKACVDFLKSGMLNHVLSISNEEIEEVDEAKVLKTLDPHYETPDNLKELWAKLKKFIELKENVMLVPRRDLIRKHVLKHFHELNGDHFSALFRLEKLLTLMHQDMVKLEPELAKYLNKMEDSNTFGIVNSLTRLMQQDWFNDYRTDKQYNAAWIEKFLGNLMRSEWGHVILLEWENVRKRPKLKCKIIGAIKDAGILKSDYQTIAEKMDMGNNLPAETHANYMGYGKAQPYFEWICDYVKA